MKYREFLKEQKNIIKRIGEKKHQIVKNILKETNVQVSFKEALEIVSNISDDETNSVQSEVRIIENPHMMALHLGMADRVLLGECELKGYDESDFEINDKFAVLIQDSIYIYIPNGEYIYM